MNKQKQMSTIEKAGLLLLVLIALNIGTMVLLTSQSKTITLLKEQKRQLESDQKILSSSDQIYSQYENQIEKIFAVFPDEESVLSFLQTFEELTKAYSTESSVRFASLNPLPEGDKLFLLFSVSLKSDRQRLNQLLDKLETLPYMTRVLNLNVIFSDPELNNVDASFTLKLYVKNPFTVQ